MQDLDNILAHTELDVEHLAKFLAKRSRNIPSPLYTLILEYLTSVGEHKLNFYGTRNRAGAITLPDPDHRSMIPPPRGNDHPELMTAVVDLEPERDGMVIEPRHVITHLTTWKRPADIYKTKKLVSKSAGH